MLKMVLERRVTMMKRMLCFLLAAALLAALAAGLAMPAIAAPPNLAVNGGFEQPFTYLDWFPTGTPGLGWSVDKVSGGPSIGLEIQRGIFGPTIEGGQIAELNGSEVDTIYQTLTTVPGAWYTIRFAFSPRPATPPYMNQMAVIWDGEAVGTIGPTASDSTNNLWQYHEYLVHAHAGSTELRFTSTDPNLADSAGVFIDDVSVIKAAGVRSVPSTSTRSVVIMAAGLGGAIALAGFRMRRRSQANNTLILRK